VVEDAPYDTELVRHQLERDGYVVELERVDSALTLGAALANRAWDVVLCDYSMPGFSLEEALDIVRGVDEDLPFIVLSGTIGEEAVVEALKAGVRNCVLKSNLPRLAFVIEQERREAALRREARLVEMERIQAELRAALAHSTEARDVAIVILRMVVALLTALALVMGAALIFVVR
jgi:DNA-binding NtrC family response regulator